MNLLQLQLFLKKKAKNNNNNIMVKKDKINLIQASVLVKWC